jgi:hypothetical protein
MISIHKSVGEVISSEWPVSVERRCPARKIFRKNEYELILTKNCLDKTGS